MSWTWVALVGITPIVAAVRRDLVSLCRYAVRRPSIERIVRNHSGVIQIVDPATERNIWSIEVLPSTEKAPELTLRSAGA